MTDYLPVLDKALGALPDPRDADARAAVYTIAYGGLVKALASMPGDKLDSEKGNEERSFFKAVAKIESYVSKLPPHHEPDADQKPRYEIDIDEIERQLKKTQDANPPNSSREYNSLAELARIVGTEDPFGRVLDGVGARSNDFELNAGNNPLLRFARPNGFSDEAQTEVGNLNSTGKSVLPLEKRLSTHLSGLELIAYIGPAVAAISALAVRGRTIMDEPTGDPAEFGEFNATTLEELVYKRSVGFTVEIGLLATVVQLNIAVAAIWKIEDVIRAFTQSAGTSVFNTAVVLILTVSALNLWNIPRLVRSTILEENKALISTLLFHGADSRAIITIVRGAFRRAVIRASAQALGLETIIFVVVNMVLISRGHQLHINPIEDLGLSVVGPVALWLSGDVAIRVAQHWVEQISIHAQHQH